MTESEWNKLWKDVDWGQCPNSIKWLENVKAEGDRLQELMGMCNRENVAFSKRNIELEDKLEENNKLQKDKQKLVEMKEKWRMDAKQGSDYRKKLKAIKNSSKIISKHIADNSSGLLDTNYGIPYVEDIDGLAEVIQEKLNELLGVGE